MTSLLTFVSLSESTLQAEATFSRYDLLFARHLIPRKCSLCSQGSQKVKKVAEFV